MNNNLSQTINSELRLLGSKKKKNLKNIKKAAGKFKGKTFQKIKKIKNSSDLLTTEKESSKLKEIIDYKGAENLNDDSHIKHFNQNDEENDYFKFPSNESVNNKQTKRRKHDIDSNKKLLKRLTWNYLYEIIIALSSIKNIKPINMKIKNETKKRFDSEMMKKTIKVLFLEHYNLEESFILKSKYKGINDSQIITALSKSFREYFNDYRNSKAFFTDAKKSCSEDSVKLTEYLKLAKSYSNYLLNPKKTSLNQLDDDEGLSKELISEFNEMINPTSKSSNNSTKVSINSQDSNLNSLFSCPKEEIDNNNFEMGENEMKIENNEEMWNAEKIFQMVEKLAIGEKEKFNNLYNSKMYNEPSCIACLNNKYCSEISNNIPDLELNDNFYSSFN